MLKLYGAMILCLIGCSPINPACRNASEIGIARENLADSIEELLFSSEGEETEFDRAEKFKLLTEAMIKIELLNKALVNQQRLCLGMPTKEGIEL